MRKKIMQLAKKAGVEIINYRSYRVDYTQVYELTIKAGDKIKPLCEGIIIGEGGSGKDWLIKTVEKEIEKLTYISPLA
jgi:hypothetical protein